MTILDISKKDISELNDADLRELIGRLCEEDFRSKGLPPSDVLWGGAQTAADGGLDVEAVTDPENKLVGFIPRNHTGFQVKKHNMGKQACFDEMHERGKLRPIITQLISESGAYVIISGKDDCSSSMLKSRTEKMREAVELNPKHENLHIDFYGRDRIATWIRQHPNVVLWF